MAVDLKSLPQDPATLKQLVADLLTVVEERDRRIDKLEWELDRFRHYLFGRRSEKFHPGQLTLGIEEIKEALDRADESLPLAEDPSSESTPKKGRRGHGRRPLSPDLHRERIVHDLPESERACRECHTALVRIGEEVTERLDYRPASFFVWQLVRVKYACKACESHVAIAELPAQPIDKGIPGPGLLAQVSVSKFADHLPLHRQVGIFARHGVHLSVSTLCDWMGEAATMLSPIYEVMKAAVLDSKVIHTDDTPVPVQDRERTQTRTGRLWVYVGDEEHRFVVYDYTPTRCRDGPIAFLGEFAGYMQADAYAGYDAIYVGERVVEVACWAHARRRFVEAETTDRQTAHTALVWIQQLYEVEKEAAKLTAAARCARRQSRSKPILDRLKTWLDERSTVVLPKSPIGEAIAYVRSQWEALVRYVDDGDLAIDNNLAERALRCVAVGRKNWLFCGSDEGGRRAAILYSIIATCKQHDVDPLEYLTDVFSRISTHPESRKSELLPPVWKVLRTKAAA